MGALTFSVQQIGNYSYLTLEGLAIPGAALNPNLPLVPPLVQAVLGSPPTATLSSQAQNSGQQAAQLLSKPWVGWALSVSDRLNQGSVLSQAPVIVVVEAPSIDETDIDWHAWLTSAMGVDSPTTFTPTFTPFHSRYGRTFAVNDYALIADSFTFVDPVGVRRYRFEIVQIAAISSAGVWTVNRACFGTPLLPHTPAIGPMAVYRLIDAFWAVTLPSPATPQARKLPWDSMCIPVIQASVSGGDDPLLINLIQPVTAGVPAVPGFRTLSGAEYTLGAPGAIALGATSILRLSCAGWHSIRNAFFEMDGPAGAGTDTLITLAYISPNRANAYLVGNFTIPAGATTSYTTPQQNTRMPAFATWPPSSNLPLMTGGLDAAGQLQNGWTLDPTMTATIEEDGELDFIVTQTSSTAGTSLRGTVQT